MRYIIVSCFIMLVSFNIRASLLDSLEEMRKVYSDLFDCKVEICNDDGIKIDETIKHCKKNLRIL